MKIVSILCFLCVFVGSNQCAIVTVREITTMRSSQKNLIYAIFFQKNSALSVMDMNKGCRALEGTASDYCGRSVTLDDGRQKSQVDDSISDCPQYAFDLASGSPAIRILSVISSKKQPPNHSYIRPMRVLPTL